MAQSSRAEYMRERRKRFIQFTVSIPKEKNDAFCEYLNTLGKTKTQWVIEKMDEELSRNEK